jgi:preprotein translocase subunit YajC
MLASLASVLPRPIPRIPEIPKRTSPLVPSELFDAVCSLAFLAQKTAEAGNEGGGGFGGGMNLLIPILAIFLIFYFLIIRPEGRKRRELQQKLRVLQRGDEVLTTGGIFGVVRRVGESDVDVEVDKDKKVRIRFAKSAILDVVSAGTEGAAGADARAVDRAVEKPAQEGIKT